MFVNLTNWHSCVCPVIDQEFRKNIAKVAVDPRGDSRVDPQQQTQKKKLSNRPLWVVDASRKL